MKKTKQPRRLPKSLKKKLEASLSSLTPRQAARLSLLYFREADESDAYIPGEELPQVKELQKVFLDRLEAAEKKKDPEEYNRQVKLLNGYRLLYAIAINANDWVRSEGYRIAFLSLGVAMSFDKLMREHYVSGVARLATNLLLAESPKPVTREEYNMIAEWYSTRGHWEVSEAAKQIATAWAKGQGLRPLEEYDYEENDDEFNSLYENAVSDEDARKLQAERFNLLDTVFAGDQSALDFWIQTGPNWGGAGLTADLLERIEAKQTEAVAQLTDAIKRGDVVGGEAIELHGCFDSVAIADDKSIPAWAALRAVWVDWVLSHDLLLRNDREFNRHGVRGIRAVYNIDGNLEGEELKTVVAEFVADCRAKPWGSGLSKDIDFDRLGQFLIATYSELDNWQGEALKLGRVDLETFKAHEAEAFFFDGQVSTFVTVGSLKAKSKEWGMKPEDFRLGKLIEDDEGEHFEEEYYPTTYPEGRRERLNTALTAMQSLLTSQVNLDLKEGSPVEEFFGPAFASPLRDNLELLNTVLTSVANIDKTLEELSDEYFDGDPIAGASQYQHMTIAKEYLESAQKTYNKWVEIIDDFPVKKDWSSLQIKQPEVNADIVKSSKELIVGKAKLILRKNSEYDFGSKEGEDNEE